MLGRRGLMTEESEVRRMKVKTNVKAGGGGFLDPDG